MEIKHALIQRLDHARAALQTLFSEIDHDKYIYPQWTLKELLEHFAGWDNLVTASLEAHTLGEASKVPMIDGIDSYNAQSVLKRSGIDFAIAYDQFITSREKLKQKILDLNPEQMSSLFSLPWGGEGTVSQIVEIFAHHEEQHTADLLRWLNDPERPII
jgi:hypothetical protein